MPMMKTRFVDMVEADLYLYMKYCLSVALFLLLVLLVALFLVPVLSLALGRVVQRVNGHFQWYYHLGIPRSLAKRCLIKYYRELDK